MGAVQRRGVCGATLESGHACERPAINAGLCGRHLAERRREVEGRAKEIARLAGRKRRDPMDMVASLCDLEEAVQGVPMEMPVDVEAEIYEGGGGLADVWSRTVALSSERAKGLKLLVEAQATVIKAAGAQTAIEREVVPVVQRLLSIVESALHRTLPKAVAERIFDEIREGLRREIEALRRQLE
jgi:hypothetical protein